MLEEPTFGAWLRDRRLALRLSQAELARQAGCSAQTIKKIEQGRRRPSPAAAGRLADCLAIPTAERAAFVAFARGGRLAAAPGTWPARSSILGTLPLPTTSYIGATAAVAAVCGLLQTPEVRLLTLTGPPGIGKTRLALQVALRLAAGFADGVCFVPLGAIQDPGLVAATILHHLGVSRAAERPWADAAGDYLREKHLLLVLDNFEQVLAAAPLIATLLVAPRLKVLVTSRASLHLYGEQLWPLQPLALPDRASRPPVEELAAYPAIRLFVERARAARPDFALDAGNAAAVAEICTRLDGLPLAIELAAAGVRLLGPAALLAHYTHRLDLSQDGPRGRPPRQQALRLAIGWSYDLLDRAEQQIFRRLAVFRGGCDLAAVQAMGTSGAEAPAPPNGSAPAAVWATLLALTDQSLLRVDERAGTPRFSMLETIQEYALEQLANSAESAAVHRQHAHYFRAFAEQTRREWAVSQPAHWLDVLEIEHDNLRAALAWCEAEPTDEGRRLGLALTEALWRFWELHDHIGEGRRRLTAALAWAEGAAPVRQAALLWNAGRFATVQGDYAAARDLLARALTHWQAHGDRFLSSFALLAVGNVALAQGDRTAAAALYAESLAIRRRIGEPAAIAGALVAGATLATLAGNFAQAATLLAEALPLTSGRGHEYDRALVLLSAADLALRQGDRAQAQARLDEAWTLVTALGHRAGLAECLAAYGRTAAAAGHPARAAQLFGATAAQLDAAGVRLSPPNQAEYERELAAVCAQLGASVCAAHLATGRRLAPEEARRAAPAEPPATAATAAEATPTRPDGLTARERAVLAALAGGLTNAQIAGRLALSPHTVNAHLRSIYAKLEVRTRSAATRYALEHHLA